MDSRLASCSTLGAGWIVFEYADLGRGCHSLVVCFSQRKILSTIGHASASPAVCLDRSQPELPDYHLRYRLPERGMTRSSWSYGLYFFQTLLRCYRSIGHHSVVRLRSRAHLRDFYVLNDRVAASVDFEPRKGTLGSVLPSFNCIVSLGCFVTVAGTGRGDGRSWRTTPTLTLLGEWSEVQAKDTTL